MPNSKNIKYHSVTVEEGDENYIRGQHFELQVEKVLEDELAENDPDQIEGKV